MSSYSCVTARLAMRSVLQTQGDSRARSGPFVGLVRRPFMASCYSPYRRRTSRLYAATYYCMPRHSTRESDWRRPTSQEAGGAGATRTGDRPDTKGKREGEEMT